MSSKNSLAKLSDVTQVFLGISNLLGTKTANPHCVLSKCANLRCSQPFLRLRHGRLFHFPRTLKAGKNSMMESFWLCNDCSRRLTLQWKPGEGVLTVPLPEPATIVPALSGAPATPPQSA